MAGVGGERKKQVHFARLEEEVEGKDRRGGDDDDGGTEEVASASSEGSCSARLVLQPEVIVAGGSGRRSRADGRGGVATAAEEAVLRRALKWCISAALCAAFLGLVRGRRGGQTAAAAARAPWKKSGARARMCVWTGRACPPAPLGVERPAAPMKDTQDTEAGMVSSLRRFAPYNSHAIDGL